MATKKTAKATKPKTKKTSKTPAKTIAGKKTSTATAKNPGKPAAKTSVEKKAPAKKPARTAAGKKTASKTSAGKKTGKTDITKKATKPTVKKQKSTKKRGSKTSKLSAEKDQRLDLKSEEVSYEKARKKVEKLKGFYTHLMVYLMVNTVLLIINLTASREYLWVVWPMLGWGVGLLTHGLSIFGVGLFGDEWEEEKIQEILKKK